MALQLNTASQLAEPVGYSVTEVIDVWYSGSDSVEVHALMALALIRVERAFGFFCISLMFFIYTALDVMFTQRRDERLIKALKEAGKW